MKHTDLFIGNFPGCVVVADKSVMEHGDYKKLAYISHAGNVQYFVQQNNLPDFVLDAIQRISKENRKKFDENFERELSYGETHPSSYRLLDRMLDTLTPTEFLDFCKKEICGVQNRCLALREIYTARC